MRKIVDSYGNVVPLNQLLDFASLLSHVSEGKLLELRARSLRSGAIDDARACQRELTRRADIRRAAQAA